MRRGKENDQSKIIQAINNPEIQILRSANNLQTWTETNINTQNFNKDLRRNLDIISKKSPAEINQADLLPIKINPKNLPFSSLMMITHHKKDMIPEIKEKDKLQSKTISFTKTKLSNRPKFHKNFKAINYLQKKSSTMKKNINGQFLGTQMKST